MKKKMGIDYSSKLILGVQINYEAICKFLKDAGVESCSENGQCFCQEDCWNFNPFPEGLYLINTRPYYDCHREYCNYYMSIIEGDSAYGLEDLLKILNDKELSDKLLSFVEDNKLGSDTDIILRSEPDIL